MVLYKYRPKYDHDTADGANCDSLNDESDFRQRLYKFMQSLVDIKTIIFTKALQLSRGETIKLETTKTNKLDSKFIISISWFKLVKC